MRSSSERDGVLRLHGELHASSEPDHRHRGYDHHQPNLNQCNHSQSSEKT